MAPVRILFACLFLPFLVKAQPVNKRSTPETVALYKNLCQLGKEGFLFGHQDDLAYGVGWRDEKGRSDVKDACGDYPGMYGWDIGGLELSSDKEIDGIPFNKLRKFVQGGYERGGVITFSWHAISPLGSNKNAWDTTHGTVRSILPGGENHELYKKWLDNAATFFHSLKGKNGEAIPILFRPFHELTGNWFWWCRNTCSPEEFITLWRFTVHYLNNIKGLNNILWVYNTSSNITSKEFFLERYPGDDVVDILSIDGYQSDEYQPEKEFVTNIKTALDILKETGREKNKPTALAETGYEAIPDPDWWTNVLMKAVEGTGIAYLLVWRNHGYMESQEKMHYYAPYKGQVSEVDFKKFYKDERTIFERDALKRKLYKAH